MSKSRKGTVTRAQFKKVMAILNEPTVKAESDRILGDLHAFGFARFNRFDEALLRVRLAQTEIR